MRRRNHLFGRRALGAAWTVLVSFLALATATQAVVPLQLVEWNCQTEEFEEGSEPIEQSGEEETPTIPVASSIRIRSSEGQPSQRLLLPILGTTSTRACSSREGSRNSEIAGRNGVGSPLRC